MVPILPMEIARNMEYGDRETALAEQFLVGGEDAGREGASGSGSGPPRYSTISALLSLVDIPPLVKEMKLPARITADRTFHARRAHGRDDGNGGNLNSHTDHINHTNHSNGTNGINDVSGINGTSSSQVNSLSTSRTPGVVTKGKGKKVVVDEAVDDISHDGQISGASTSASSATSYGNDEHGPAEECWQRWHQPAPAGGHPDKAAVIERAFGTIHEWLERCISPRACQGRVRAVRAFSTAGNYPQARRYYKFLECLARFSEQRFEQWIAKFYGWFESEDAVFVATEYFAEGDLGSYLQEHSRLIEDDAADITAQLLEGLTFVHDLGFAHRNIKAETILIKSRGTAGWKVKIGDFGISKPLEAAVQSSLDGDFQEKSAALEILGIHGFDVDRDHVVKEQGADMYCTGELVYHMLTKDMPFEDSVGLTNYVLSPDIFPTYKLRACGVSDAAIDFVKAAMRPVPDTRPTVRQALEHAWIKPRTSNVHFLAEPPPSYDMPPIEPIISTTPYLAPSRTNSLTRHVVLPGTEPPAYLSFSTTSHLLLSVSDRGTLTLWDLRTQTRTHTSFQPDVLSRTLLAALSPSGSSIITGSIDGTLRLWTLSPGQLTREMSPPTGIAITSAAYSPDGHLAATGDASGALAVWDAATGALLVRPAAHCAGVSAIAFMCAPGEGGGGRCLMASAARDGSVVLADVRAWTPPLALAPPGSAAPGAAPAALRFSPDGRWLVSVAPARNWRAWDVSPSAAARAAAGSGAVPGVEARPVGHGARHGDGFSAVDVTFGGAEAALLAGGADALASRFVVAAVRGKSEAFVRLYRGPGLTGAVGKLRGHERRPGCLAFSADGRMLASGAPDNSVRVWNTAAVVNNK